VCDRDGAGGGDDPFERGEYVDRKFDVALRAGVETHGDRQP